MEVTINGKRFKTNSLRSIGKGGEADIFDIGGGFVLKLFKTPSHPDYAGNPHEQKGAKERILAHQKKLAAFPKNLPNKVVAPRDLAFTSAGEVAGYTMPFVGGGETMIRYSEKSFRSTGVDNGTVTEIFQDLHSTVCGIHQARVVVGDFNDLNEIVLSAGGLRGVYVIDADSFQFGKFFCLTFTQKFVDPLLCNPKEDSPLLVKPHNDDSDWYAFAVMLMQSLLYVGPYGGVYKPKNAASRVSHVARPLHRITVFDPDVIYPKPATHWSVLSDDLLQFFHRVFKKDEREVFPFQLLQKLQWRQCPKCGLEFARQQCPVCQPQIGGIVKEKIIQTVQGKVTATSIIKTAGAIVFATYQHGLKYLAYDNGQLKRENGEIVYRSTIDPQIRYRISGKRTIVGKQGQMFIFKDGEVEHNIAIDANGTVPCFDANEENVFWMHSGQLVRDANLGTTEYIGDVLEGQTLSWVGPTFGFGFYWAGMLRIAFVFDALRRGINDTVKLPPMRGQLIDTKCFFAKDRCWFFWTAQENGARVNHCVVIKKDGTVIAEGQTTDGDGSWLGTIGARCAIGEALLVATDEGIVQVKIEGGVLVEAKRFPDTEPFVNTGCSLFAGSDGLYVVTRHEVLRLTIQ